MKGEEEVPVPPKSKAKRRKEEAGIHGFNAQTLKLDLKNSKWWNTGFNNDYLQEQLNKFLIHVKEQSEFEGEKADLSSISQFIPLEVRGAADGMKADQTVIEELQMKSDKKDIRVAEPEELEMRDAGEVGEIPLFASPIADMTGGEGSPQFGAEPMELLNMFAKLDDKQLSKQIFGDKTFDFTDLREDQLDLDLAPPIQIPKDARRRQNFEKMIVMQDVGLQAKVDRNRENMKKKMKERVTMADLDVDELNQRMKTLRVSEEEKDPITQLIGLDAQKQQFEFNFAD